ncbi:CAAX prenyl protease 1 [Phytophthora cinnamomi]|uniref:CAAX prenyl protease 1 n=1 Tax=Phytophthora cinnamomi TaxID=4785 RepID=UPI003559F223|nr:CAAX prenyl protease 1 [Phytophthora cinnamomi]
MTELSWWEAPLFREPGWRPSASPVPYFQAALVFMTLVFVFETYLDVRQHRKLHDKKFPQPLAEAIEGLGSYSFKKKEEKTEKEEEEEEGEGDKTQKQEKETTLLEATRAKFDKSRAYGLDKSTFGFVSGGYNQLEATAFLLLGYLPFAWTMSGKALLALGLDADNEIYRALMLLTLTTLRDTLVGIPFGLYSTFVVEARHGFNKQTLGLFFMDKIKSFMLFVVIGFPVTAALIYVIRWGGEYFYMYVWAFLFVFSVVMMTLYPVLIMPLFNKFTPLEEGELRTRIEALAASLNFPLTKLFVTDGSKRSSHSNAYFFGLFKSKRIVLFDTLLEQATHDEIVAVLGHELGHWKLWHTAQGFVIQQVYILASFYVFGLCMNDAELFASFGFAGDSAKPVIIGFLLFSQTMWAPVEHVLSFLITLNTRKNEFQADAFAVDLGHDVPLKSGLTKLAIENLSNMNPDALYSAYHYSHPPLVERLNAITLRAKKSQ